MIQFIVLLSIMAIWALTSLLSREAQPLPPRPTRGPTPEGLRPNLVGRTDLSGANRDASAAGRTSGGLPDRRAPARWSDPVPPSRSTTGSPTVPHDGIVIIESEMRSSRPANGSFAGQAGAAGSRVPTRAGQVRRGARGRSPSNPTKAPEPGRPRALTSQVTESMAQKRNKPLEIAPLSSPLSLNDSPLAKLTTRQQPAERNRYFDAAPSLNADTVRAMIASPGKLRELALLSEILQPPVSVRKRRRPE
jgi:hypothetical protein